MHEHKFSYLLIIIFLMYVYVPKCYKVCSMWIVFKYSNKIHNSIYIYTVYIQYICKAIAVTVSTQGIMGNVVQSSGL